MIDLVRRFASATNFVSLALIAILSSNLVDLLAARDVMQKSIEQQNVVLSKDSKLESQLNALASGTKQLAMSGNAEAQRIVAVLEQNGVNIKTP